MMKEIYNSRKDTEDHINKVDGYIEDVILILGMRARDHDNSKLWSPEKECFDEITPLLKETTYGSDEYKATMDRMRPAIDHHHKNNRHHPEYFPNGINGMNLIDLIEMICDWKAASERHADGDIYRSIEINKDRFGMSDQLTEIFKNTVADLFRVEEKKDID